MPDLMAGHWSEHMTKNIHTTFPEHVPAFMLDDVSGDRRLDARTIVKTLCQTHSARVRHTCAQPSYKSTFRMGIARNKAIDFVVSRCAFQTPEYHTSCFANHKIFSKKTTCHLPNDYIALAEVPHGSVNSQLTRAPKRCRPRQNSQKLTRSKTITCLFRHSWSKSPGSVAEHDRHGPVVPSLAAEVRSTDQPCAGPWRRENECDAFWIPPTEESYCRRWVHVIGFAARPSRFLGVPCFEHSAELTWCGRCGTTFPLQGYQNRLPWAVLELSIWMVESIEFGHGFYFSHSIHIVRICQVSGFTSMPDN